MLSVTDLIRGNNVPHRLLPADPIWLKKFMAMEEPLLYSLYTFGSLPEPAASVVDHAYQSWARIFLRFPGPLRDYALSPHHQMPPRHDENGQYRLCGHDGRALVELHAVDIRSQDIDALSAVLASFRNAQSGDNRELAEVLEEVIEPLPGVMGTSNRLIEDFERSLRVLQLEPDGLLLKALPVDPTTRPASGDISLDPAQERAYHAHCLEIIEIVSAGDPWALSTHRRMYP
ncbi:hypothetical protein [Streptomyces sp. NPDC001948]